MGEEEEKKKSVLFNLGQSQLELIGHLLNKASEGYRKNSLYDFWNALKQIRIQISPRTNKIEEVKLRLCEAGINKAIHTSKIETYGEREDDRFDKLSSAAMPFVVKYQEMIMGLLEKKGYLIPLKEKETSVFGRGKSTPDEE